MACVTFLIESHVNGDSDDRMVAEWVLDHGGTVGIAGLPGRINEITQLPVEAFELELIDLVGANILPPDLVRLSKLQKLTRLFLPGPMWNPSAGARVDYSKELKHLAGLPRLEELTFSSTYLEGIKFQDDGLAEIASIGPSLRKLSLENTAVKGRNLSAFRNLESLDLVYCPLDDKGAKELHGLTQLKELLIRDAIISDDGIMNLSGIHGLERLDLGGTKVSDVGCVVLRGMPRLKKLSLQGTSVTDKTVNWIATMPELRELNLYGTQVSNAGVESLASLSQLQFLDVRYSRVSRAGVEALRRKLPDCKIDFVDVSLRPAVPKDADKILVNANPKEVADWIVAMGGGVDWEQGQLIRASFASTGLTNRLLANISTCRSLRALDLQDTEVDDGGIKLLTGLVSLRELNVSGTGISDEGLESLGALSGLTKLVANNTRLKGSGFRWLENLELIDLSFNNTLCNDVGLKHLASINSLRSLSLAYSDVTDSGLKHITSLQRLEYLDLDGTDVGDAGMESAGKIMTLKALLLGYTKISDKGLKRLAELNQLQRLRLIRTRISNAGLDTVAGLVELRELNMDYTDVSDDGMQKIAVLVNLQDLSLDSANVTDASAVSLVKLSRLLHLNLYHTFYTTAGFDTLVKNLPNCRIIFDPTSSDPKRRRS
jgi:Leucine-rich repeat (LRR) protein